MQRRTGGRASAGGKAAALSQRAAGCNLNEKESVLQSSGRKSVLDNKQKGPRQGKACGLGNRKANGLKQGDSGKSD